MEWILFTVMCHEFVQRHIKEKNINQIVCHSSFSLLLLLLIETSRESYSKKKLELKFGQALDLVFLTYFKVS